MRWDTKCMNGFIQAVFSISFLLRWLFYVTGFGFGVIFIAWLVADGDGLGVDAIATGLGCTQWTVWDNFFYDNINLWILFNKINVIALKWRWTDSSQLLVIMNNQLNWVTIRFFVFRTFFFGHVQVMNGLSRLWLGMGGSLLMYFHGNFRDFREQFSFE